MLHLDFSVFPVLRTERLLLREVLPEDAPALFSLRSDERVMRYIPRPVATTVADVASLIAVIAKDRAENNALVWAITLHGSGALIGTIGYHRIKKEHHRGEVGYMLHPDHWGHGFVGEALESVVCHGFDVLGFHSIEAVTDPDNAASNALLARHGFRQEAHFREDCYWNGRFLDTLVWSRLAGDRR